MGTNYYVFNLKKPGNEGRHIGKKSAAGLYCWDCKITLCKAGNEFIHKGCHHSIGCNCGWYSKCPVCGKLPARENLKNSSAGRELGFNTSEYKKKKGVRSCSSFSWAIYPSRIKKIQGVVDEYGRILNKAEFDSILLECPIQYTRLVGQEFC